MDQLHPFPNTTEKDFTPNLPGLRILGPIRQHPFPVRDEGGPQWSDQVWQSL